MTCKRYLQLQVDTDTYVSVTRFNEKNCQYKIELKK